ncbi:MAG: D-glycero-beta-D-manno-heptose 1-phosphate adenylyltransferase, partial [Thiohalomonadales bacterium]
EQGVVGEQRLVELVRASKDIGESVIMTNGCFDILHQGHISYLQQARALGDRLIVAVNSDASVRELKGESRPINTVDSRMVVLAALSCVDWVVSFVEDTPERLYCSVLPDVVVKGGDYERHEVAGGACVEKAGGKVEILSFVDGFSTSDIIERIKGERK